MINNPIVVENGSNPVLQTKSVTPSTSQQTITPDNGYDGLSSVTVKAMPTATLSTPTISVNSAGKITAKVEQAAAGYVEAGSKSATKQLTTKGAATITPGTSDQSISSGTYLTGAQTVKGDANLVSGNIKSGVSIFGVTGSFEGSGAYVWEKYDVLNLYKAQTEMNGSVDPPSDLTGSGYEGYTLDTTTGEFTLTGDVITTVPNYYASTSKSKIYKHTVVTITIGGTPTTSGSTQTLQSYTAINAVQDSPQKGSTCYGTVTSEDETAYPADGEQDGYWYVLVGKTGAEGGGDSPVLQAKSVTPSESTQTVTPDAGYDGLSSVSVSAIQTETKTVTSNGTVTPSSGKYLKQVTVNVPASGIDTSDATATADDIAQGKTAYINGGKVNGALLDYLSDETATFAANYTQVSDHDDSKFLCRGTNSGDKILRDGAYANVYVRKNVFGDATAADVAQGKTFTSSSGLKITGTHVCSGGIDTSDATATASDIAEGVTAYVNGEKITGTIQKPSTVYNLGLPEVQAAKVNDTRIRLEMPTRSGPYIVGRGVTVQVGIDSDKISNVLGDATPEDVASGKTFSAGGGFTMVGTATASTPTLQEKSVTPSATEQTVTPDSGYNGLSRVTVNGDVNLVAENIKSGVSIFGVAGNFDGSSGSGGSGDNNCEAYHITSASDVLSFKTTGTVKVWGYGSKRSNYTTTVYAFVGDGYYAGSSYGTPSKTSASFSINADGTLNGLPSGLEAVDLLVTIGA